MQTELRPVRESDLENIYRWRNDPGVRKNSFSTGKISMEEHLRYWDGRMEDASKHSFVIVVREASPPVSRTASLFKTGGKDAGLLRLDPYESDGESEKGAYEVHILVAPGMQGKGIGLAAIAAAKQEAKKLGIKKLVARVKEGNEASQAVFQKNGFAGGPALFECKI